MFASRTVATQPCVFVPLVVCSLMMLYGASAGPARTKPQNHPAARLIGVHENCSSSTPAFPPSLSIRPVFLLYQRFSRFLQITPDGRVNGIHLPGNYTRMEMETVGVCLTRLKGVVSGRYLAMKNVTSELYSQAQPDLDAVFRLRERNYFTALESYQYPKWFVGLRRNGLPRKGKKVPPDPNAKGDGEFAYFVWSLKSNGLKPLYP